ncbi:MAG TPA: PAS domain S-box protein, partial [Methanoregulaceae archaeon]|nr:PAS domain S-box protein [Methanoregulaceae archaeon]
AWEVRPWYTIGNTIGGIIIFSEDITWRKQAEAALRESEEKYRNLVENSLSIIYTMLPDGTFTFVSPSWKKFLGHEISEVVGKNFRAFVHPDDIPMCEGFLELIVESGGVRTSTGDYRIYHKDGSVHWNRSSVMPVFDAAGNLSLLVGNAIDVTTRKRAEDALLESRAELASILHGSPVLQFVIDRDHHIVSWNKALEEYTGLSAADVVGTDQQWRPFYPEKRPVLADLLIDNRTGDLTELYGGSLKPSPYVEGAYEATGFFPLVGESGSWLSFTAAPVRNAEGTIIGAVETLEDITERVDAEAALRETGEKYRRILENMQDGYFQVDENGIITMVNPSAVRMYGYAAAEEMIGLPAHALYARPEAREEMLRNLRDATPGGLTDFNADGLRKDGTTFGISLSVQFNRDEEGGIRGTEAIVRDISERRAMEHALQEANRKLTLLGSITRHDVANKVAVINGYAQAARMQKLTPEIAVYLSKIEAAGADISRQIAFTKTYQELGVNAPTWVSIPDLVERQRAEGVAITCTCHAEVYADPMLEKVFFNLIDNAVRHGEKVTEIAIRCNPGPDGLVVTVADNGAGVPEELKEKIFDRGFGKHTGFGLFLAREILALTGITIRETGTPGQGAKFEMVVPKGLYRGV